MRRKIILISASFMGAFLLVFLLKGVLGDSYARKDKKLRRYGSHYEMVEKLAGSNRPGDIALLINYVENPPDGKRNSGSVANIIESLQPNTSAEVLDFLIAQSPSQTIEANVGRRLATALGNHTDKRSTEALFQLLPHHDPSVRAAAISSLIKLRSQMDVPYVDAIPLLAGRAFDDRFLMQILARDPELPVTFRHWAEWWFPPNEDSSAGAYWNHGVEERGKEAFIDFLQTRGDTSAQALLCLSLQEEMRYGLHPKIIEKLLETPNPYIDAFLLDLFAEDAEKRYEHTLELPEARKRVAPYLLKKSLIDYHQVDRMATLIDGEVLDELKGQTDPKLLASILERLREITQRSIYRKQPIQDAIEFLGEAEYVPAIALLMTLSKDFELRESCHVALARIGTDSAIEYLLTVLNDAYDDRFSSLETDRVIHALLANRNHPWIEAHGSDLAAMVSYGPGHESFLADYACLRLIQDLRFPVLRQLIAKRLTPVCSVQAPVFIQVLSEWDEPEAKQALMASGDRVRCPACRAQACAALGNPLACAAEKAPAAHRAGHTSYVWKEKFIGVKPLADAESAINALPDPNSSQTLAALLMLYQHPETRVDPQILYSLFSESSLPTIYDLSAYLLTRQRDDPRTLPLWSAATVVDWMKRDLSNCPAACFHARLSAAFASDDYHLPWQPLNDFYELLRDEKKLDVVFDVFQSNIADLDAVFGNQTSYLRQFFERILPTCGDQLQPKDLTILKRFAELAEGRSTEAIWKVISPKVYSVESRLFESRSRLNDRLSKENEALSDPMNQPLWAESILLGIEPHPKASLRELDKLWGYRNPLLLPAGPGVQVHLWSGGDPQDALDMLHFLKGRSENTSRDFSPIQSVDDVRGLVGVLKKLDHATMTRAQYAALMRFQQSVAIPLVPSTPTPSVSFQKSIEAYKQGDFQTAEAGFTALSNQHPDDLDVLNNLALVWFHTQRQASALILWDWICQHTPTPHLGALTNRFAAEVYFEFKEEAAKTARLLHDCAPHSIQATYAMAFQHVEAGLWEDAKSWVKKCQAQAPLFYRAHYLDLLIDTQTGEHFVDPVLQSASFDLVSHENVSAP